LILLFILLLCKGNKIPLSKLIEFPNNIDAGLTPKLDSTDELIIRYTNGKHFHHL
jgi:hypothetical protein